jgi:hypothetical protein
MGHGLIHTYATEARGAGERCPSGETPGNGAGGVSGSPFCFDISFNGRIPLAVFHDHGFFREERFALNKEEEKK